MSVNRYVARDNRIVLKAMSEAAVLRAYSRLNELTTLHYRGRHDTWGAALGRTADTIGIPDSYAHRLWHRWKTMKDVSGGALLAIDEAYKKLCLKQEEAADHYRSLEREPDGQTSSEGTSIPAVGVVALQRSKGQTTSRRIHRD